MNSQKSIKSDGIAKTPHTAFSASFRVAAYRVYVSFFRICALCSGWLLEIAQPGSIAAALAPLYPLKYHNCENKL